jgi:hypothetical protein
MITKIQIKDLVDSKNQFKHVIDVPWEQTSLSRLYDMVDATIQGGALIDIASVKPIEFNKESETITVEMVLDCSDLFQEEPDTESNLKD